MTGPLRTRLAWVLGALLVAAHLWPWGVQGHWTSWMPAELGLRLVWLAASFAYLLWFCGAVWGDEEGEG